MDKPSDVLSVGQEIDAKIVEFREGDHKISLSMKALAAQNERKSADEDYASVDVEKVGQELADE